MTPLSLPADRDGWRQGVAAAEAKRARKRRERQEQAARRAVGLRIRQSQKLKRIYGKVKNR